MQSKIKKHICTELLIDLIQGALEEEGHLTKRYSDGNTHFTTAYDCIMVKGADGNYYTLTVDECITQKDPRSGKICRPEDKFEHLDNQEA